MIALIKWRPIARLRQLGTRLSKDNHGATLLEFAFVAPVLLLFLIGGIELGYKAYMRSVTNGVLERAARMATAGQLNDSQIDNFIRDQLKVIASGNDTSTAIQINKLNYYNFSNVGAGEKITGDTAPMGTYNSTDCYEDRNNNGIFDALSGGASGVGGADDIVFYDVTVTVPSLLPFAGVMSLVTPSINSNNNNANTEVVSARTIIRNQPFATQVLVTRCS
jgi:Flp pilus assembly protein TadG